MIRRIQELLALTTAAAVVSACAPSSFAPTAARTARIAEAALEQPLPGSALSEGDSTSDRSQTVPVALTDPAAEATDPSPPPALRAAPIRISRPAIPEGPRRIGLQVGHWKTDEVPPELRRLETQTGTNGGGVNEWQLNLDIATRVATLLRARGLAVDIIPTLVPTSYLADVFVSLHADGDPAGAARGFKAAHGSRRGPYEDQLVRALLEEYGKATGLPEDFRISRNMLGYYAFSWSRFQWTAAPHTPAAILEMGFMTSAADRAVLLQRPTVVAEGVANGILRFLDEVPQSRLFGEDLIVQAQAPRQPPLQPQVAAPASPRGSGIEAMSRRRRVLLGGTLALAACVTPQTAATQDTPEAEPSPPGSATTAPITPAPTTPASTTPNPTPPPFTAPPQIRALWVDAFHDGIKSPTQIDKLVRDAQSANVNTLIVQVRRRGDAYYTRTNEPGADDPRLARGFDGLQALIERAHAAQPRIEVHAWMATVALWKEQRTPPANPAHTFNTHGPTATGDDMWLSLNDRGQAWDAENFMLDPGHPAAAQYIATVAEELARNYDVDGVHLDLVRYAGFQWGYNPLSLARFQRRHGLPDGAPLPAPNEARWQQWRRDQVSALVRRVYLDCVAVRPAVKVSAAVIGWGAGPTDEASWRRTSTYTNVFQDWKAWLEEGIVDLALPMNYDDEANAEQRVWFDRWVAWGRERQGKRQTAIGVGLFLNKPDAGLSQINRALAASPRGAQAAGVALYSYAVSNVPARGSDEPELPNERFFGQLTAAGGPFTGLAPVPDMPWKSQPAGHMRGTVMLGGVQSEGAAIRLEGPTRATAVSDGAGYFGSVDLTPGAYTLTLLTDGRARATATAEVTPGQVTTVGLAV